VDRDISRGALEKVTSGCSTCSVSSYLRKLRDENTRVGFLRGAGVGRSSPSSNFSTLRVIMILRNSAAE
jgi:hypothetical protein